MGYDICTQYRTAMAMGHWTRLKAVAADRRWKAPARIMLNSDEPIAVLNGET